MIDRLYRQRWFLRLVAAYLRHPRAEFGRWRLMRRALPAAREVLTNRRPCIVRTRHKFKITVDVSDWLGQYVYLSGEYEPSTSRLLNALLQPGDHFVDVGANVGYFTLLAAACVGPTGKVTSFEALPSTRDKLNANILLNGYRQCKVIGTALSDTEGIASFYEGPKEHLGVSSLRRLEDSIQVHEVRTARLSSMIDADARIALVKIDVEGAEYKVLQGMIEVIQRDHPDIVLEVTNDFLEQVGDSAEKLFDFMKECGYRKYRIDYDGLHEIIGDENLPKQFNAFFTIHDSLPEIAGRNVKKMGYLTNSAQSGAR